LQGGSLISAMLAIESGTIATNAGILSIDRSAGAHSVMPIK